MYLCGMVENEVLTLVNKGEMLPLMEEFYTIQGEGFHKGTAAYFIGMQKHIHRQP